MEPVLDGFEAVIGLEVHAQLLTESKAFCSCPAMYGSRPNVNVCPICLGHPGALPVVNEHLVEFAVRMGLATNCVIRPISTFSRKNYFYPDLPKGYQISQYQDPICHDGWVEFEMEHGTKRVGITRIHMEEDSGKSIHDLDIDTLVDLNRSSVPLIEIVSEPDIRTAREASLYLQHMRQTLVYLGICDGNLEEGSMRCDANVSVRPVGTLPFGTKTEVKNLNSFRNVEKAIEFEIRRQVEVIRQGDSVRQVTMMWDAGRQETRMMRTKEMAHDYRYFPEPDLGPVLVTAERLETIRKALPELALAKKRRLIEQYGVPAYDAAILIDDVAVANYFEETCSLLTQQDGESFKLVSNWIMTDVLRVMGEKKCSIAETGLTTRQLASLVNAITSETISSKTAKEIFPDILGTTLLADDIIAERGLSQVSDTTVISQLVQTVLENNPDNLRKYHEGKTNLLGFFVGQVLKSSGGSANPTVVSNLMREALEAHRVE